MANLRVRNGDWVLIGDGKKALLLHNEGDAELLNLRRLTVRAVGEHAGAEPAAAWHEIDEAKFADDIAEMINREAHAQTFKRLIVVAPPKVLGDLRGAFSHEAQGRIVAEINKDLTKHSIREIEKLLPTYEV